MLSHWSCSKLALPPKGPEVLEPTAAPVRLASAGVVDVLAELIDAPAAGVALREPAPTALVQKASEVLRALFEHQGHICLFCMKHYKEVKQIVYIGCESFVADMEQQEMQREAVELFCEAFERFAIKEKNFL